MVTVSYNSRLEYVVVCQWYLLLQAFIVLVLLASNILNQGHKKTTHSLGHTYCPTNFVISVFTEVEIVGENQVHCQNYAHWKGA